MCLVRIEMVAPFGMLLGPANDIEQVLSNLFRVRRGAPPFASVLLQWATGAVDVNRPDWDGVAAWSVVRVIGIRAEGGILAVGRTWGLERSAALSRSIELGPLHRAIRNSRIGAGR